MERLTEKNGDGYVLRGDAAAALERLARFEDAWCALLEQRERAAAGLAAMRAEKKEKTARFSQFMVNKLNADNFLSLLKVYGIE